jgi:hypothetical protein
MTMQPKDPLFGSIRRSPTSLGQVPLVAICLDQTPPARNANHDM